MYVASQIQVSAFQIHHLNFYQSFGDYRSPRKLY